MKPLRVYCAKCNVTIKDYRVLAEHNLAHMDHEVVSKYFVTCRKCGTSDKAYDYDTAMDLVMTHSTYYWHNTRIVT